MNKEAMMKKADAQIEKVKKLHNGWKGETSLAPNESTVEKVSFVMNNLVTEHEILPMIFPTLDGGVTIERRHSDTGAILSVTILKDGSMLRYADDGSDDNLRSWGDDNPVWFDAKIAIGWLSMDFAFPSKK